jgi:hypothetical protein
MESCLPHLPAATQPFVDFMRTSTFDDLDCFARRTEIVWCQKQAQVIRHEYKGRQLLGASGNNDVGCRMDLKKMGTLKRFAGIEQGGIVR